MSHDELRFRKLKLVPIGEVTQQAKQHVVGAIEKHLRTYDPKLRAMANNYVGIREALHGKKKGLTARQQLNLLNSNRARYLRLLKPGANAEVPITLPDTLPTILPTVEQQVEEQDSKASVSLLDREDSDDKVKPVPLIAIPSGSHHKFKAVMEASADTIKPGRHGEVVIQDKVLPNTSYADVMRGLFVNRKAAVPGLAQTVTELKRLGVPVTRLKSKTAIDLYKKAEPEQTGSGRRRKKVKKLRKLKTQGMVGGRKYPKVLRLY